MLTSFKIKKTITLQIYYTIGDIIWQEQSNKTMPLDEVCQTGCDKRNRSIPSH